MEKITKTIIGVVVVVAGVIVVGFAWFTAKEQAEPKKINKDNIYDADIPSFSASPIDPRLLVLSPQVLAKAPEADVFTSPLGGEWGAFTYDAQPFGADNPKRGGKHTGQDLNGIGGSNTDLGDPVYAAGRGRVVYCGEPSPDWGNVVVLLHRLPDGKYIQSLYAHLNKVNVRYGDTVPRGHVVGEVGTANGNYSAHLHFEMMESICNEAGLRAYGKTTANRIDPVTIFEQYPPSDKTLMPDPLDAVRKVQFWRDLRDMNIRSVPADSDKEEK